MPTIDSLIEEHKKEKKNGEKLQTLDTHQQVKYLGKNIEFPRLSFLILIVVVAAAIPFILNYFNIISLSDRFPGFFDWLPLQTKEQPTIQQEQAPPTVYQPYTKDVPGLAKLAIQNLISDVLVQGVITSDLEFNKLNQELPGNVSVYTSIWRTAAGDLITSVVEISSTNALLSRQITIISQRLNEALTVQSANSLIQSYIKIPLKDAFLCKRVEIKTPLPPGAGAEKANNVFSSTKCDSAWSDADGSWKGVTVTRSLDKPVNTQILYCENKDSSFAKNKTGCFGDGA